MEYGYICFAYSKNEWIAKAIAKITKSKWSHTFITIPPILGKEMVMEAGQGGIEVVMFDIAYRDNPDQIYEVYKINVDQSKIDASILKNMRDLETTYGFLEYPWFIWRGINSYFGRDIKNQDNWSQQGKVCSGLSRNFITDIDDPILSALFIKFGKSSTNAQDIYEIVLANPELFTLIEKKD